jgi:hypothetical protein
VELCKRGDGPIQLGCGGGVSVRPRHQAVGFGCGSVRPRHQAVGFGCGSVRPRHQAVGFGGVSVRPRHQAVGIGRYPSQVRGYPMVGQERPEQDLAFPRWNRTFTTLIPILEDSS